MTEKAKTLLWAMVVITTAAFIIGSYYWLFPPESKLEIYSGEVQNLTIAVSELEATTLVRVASANGYFEDQGLNITITEQPLGKFSLEELFEGNADIATVAEVPIMKNAFSRNDFKTFSTIHESDLNIKILAQKDNGITSPQDLKGKSIGITVGTVGEFFLSSFLLQNGIGMNDVVLVDASPGELKQLLEDGEIDAISLREPHVYSIKSQLGDQVLTFEQSNIYNATFNLVAMSEFIDDNPEVIDRFLIALLQAEDFVENNQDLTISIIAEDLDLPEDYLVDTWEKSSFQVKLDQSLISTMEHEARWAIDSSSVDSDSIPNYLDFIYIDSLESVKSEVVTIIR